MKRKLLTLLLAGSMTATMFAGCGGSDPEPATDNNASNATTDDDASNADDNNSVEDTSAPEEDASVEEQTLKVAAFEGGYGADMWSEVAEAFEASHPGVTVELTIDKKIEDVISPSMKAGDYPDVVHLATGREAALTETLTKEKALLELTDVLDMTVPGEDVTVKDKVIPGFFDTLGTNPYGDGVTYYAPMFYSPCGLFYNAGLLKEKGWDVPTTWDEMWELGDKAKEEGIALFTYPTTGYFDAFTYALLDSAGGSDFYNSCMTYEDGIWESDNAKKVFDLIAKLAEYTESSTVANANDQGFTKNQQGGKGSSFTFFEQMWIPAAAENQDMAKEFIAYMYSDEAASIFAKSGAVQPVAGMTDQLDDDNKLFYGIYDNGATAVMGGFASTAPVEGVSMADTLFGTVNSIVSGEKTVDEWQKAVEEVSDQLREAME